ncbi:laminin subunit alpha-like isoform X3 [Biomphalaria pfeifferi]|uniref:Laminin subunit alpha-like isoform X3 n=1 Tax=Biomphalaria pfeifferi TaxID=112525 RepID=A0AAD8ASS1_BIOPF|nr:laminin subunit alpha-like isoform X3 [Biomphalaria pfeifferi]
MHVTLGLTSGTTNKECIINIDDLPHWPNVLKHCGLLQSIYHHNETILLSIVIEPYELGTLCLKCGDDRRHGSFNLSADFESALNLVAESMKVKMVGPDRECVRGWLRFPWPTQELKILLCTKRDPVQFFGKKGQYLCHCLHGGCTCPSRGGVWCSINWFGQNCQYRDMSAISLTTHEELSDNDDSTCVSLEPPSLSYTFLNPILFTWLRIVHFEELDSQDLNPLSLELMYDDQILPCNRRRVLKVDNWTEDILCTGQRVTDIILTWHSPKHVCTVHINGDRNVALKQSVVLNDNTETEVVVDGISDVLTSCVHSSFTNPMWTLTFDQSKLVHEVLVTLSKENTEVNTFFVKLIGVDNKILSQETLKKTEESPHVFSTLYTRPFEVKSIIILTTGISSPLTLCELEIFGDCAPPYFGIDCDMVCSESCLHQRCNLEGKCLACQGSKAGDLCLEVRQKHGASFNFCHCLHCDHDMSCKKGSHCVRGWFGDYCEYKDLAVNASSIHEELSDNSDMTCVRPVKNFVTVTFEELMQINWVRATFTEPAEGLEMVLYSKNPVIDEPLWCKRMRVLKKMDATNLHIYDINCGARILMKVLQLAWKSNASICSFHVYGGRNMAAVGQVWLTNPGGDTNVTARQVIDGLIDEDRCVGLSGDESKFLTLSFSAPVQLFQLNLYLAFFTTDTRSGVLEINSENEAGEMIDSKILPLPNDNVLALIDLPRMGVQKMTFVMIKGKVKFCELEVIGECAPPYYGRQCRHKCDDACVYKTCYADGACWQCPEGSTGRDCSMTAQMRVSKLLQEVVAHIDKDNKGGSIMMTVIIVCLVILATVSVFIYRYINRSQSPKRSSLSRTHSSLSND